ncbi:MAG: hypothetical protein QOC63_3208 [Mycobacterium sp.]|nr:hypothetical protein [Mycobacterium sp.]
MSGLFEQVVEAHGGLRTWRQVRTVTTGLTSWGMTWSLKGQPALLRDVTVDVATADQLLRIHPFVKQGCHGIYTPQRVRIESADGHVLEDREHPREAFAGHTLSTPWDHLHGLHFGGYALWTYLNLPFLATRPGFDVEELASWQEWPGQIWRRLRIAFPPEIHTHNRVQDLYIDHDGLIARHDYAPEILGGTPAAHYLSGYREFDGILFPTHRKVLPRGTDNRPDPQLDPEAVLIGMEFAANYTLQ